MGFEDELTRELRGVAGGVELDNVPVAGLARLGEREKRRRRALTVAGSAAALCGVLVAGFALSSVVGNDTAEPDPVVSPGPSPSSDLPEGDETTVPWIKDGVLHVGDEQIETDLEVVKHAGGTTLVGTSPFGPDSVFQRWFLVVGDELVEVVTSPYFVEIEISADGRTIAWAENSDPEGGPENVETTATINAYDVDTQDQIGAVKSPPFLCCGGDAQFVFNGPDNQGRVFFTVAELDKYVWTPGEDTFTEITGTPEVSFSPGRAWPAGIRLHDGTIGNVDDQGRFEQVASAPDNAVWSPDGERYAVSRQVVNPTTDDQVRFDLPEGATYQALTWESTDTVLLARRDPAARPRESLLGLVRCAADTGECESVADGPTERAVLPNTD